MKRNRKKLWTKTAKEIKCKYTGIRLTEADNKKHNSRAFYKLENGEYMSRSTEAMKQYLDDRYERVEHDGHNVDKNGEALLHEKFRETIADLYSDE
tara:strand:+ start:238 stop:525 length:288 start_codon:yes stop_codon:yes gene_type:complete